MTAGPVASVERPGGSPSSASLVPTAVAGVVGAVTGFASAFAVVLAGLTAVGATPAEAASGLFALCVVQGVLAMWLSWRTRLPLSFAWSTPGAAVLVAAKGTTGSFGVAVGAFLVCAALLVVTGAFPALARALTRIPIAISGALLAGVLLPLCLAPVTAVRHEPVAATAVVVVWFALHRLAPRWATPAAIVLAVVLTVVVAGGVPASGPWLPSIRPVAPVFDPLVALSLGVPLFFVTMAGQNVPGIAVLETLGYQRVPTRAVLLGTGVGSGVAALFGAHAVNLSALSAAIMAGPSAHPDRSRRWVATFTGGVTYLALAALAGAAVHLFGDTSPVLVEAAAGLALLGAFVSALVESFREPGTRLAAAATFLVAVSGVSLVGIGSAFWALVVGGAVLLVLRGRVTRPAERSSTGP
jgi:benzoate membrane transport protein